MRPVITASVPLLEPPGWATGAAVPVRPARPGLAAVRRDCTPGRTGRLRYAGRLTSRDGADDFYEVFFNWPQLYLLGGADDLLAASPSRHWHGVIGQLTELGMFRDEFERGYDWFHQGESLLLLLLPTLADPDRWRSGRCGSPTCTSTRAHGNYDPEHRDHPAAAQRQRRGPGRGCVDGAALPVAAAGGRAVRLSAGLAGARRRRAPALDADPRLGAEMQRRHGPRRRRRSTSASPGWSSTPSCVTGSRATATGSRATSAPGASAPPANGGMLPDNVGAGRRGRRPAGRPLVRRALRLVLAARLVQRRRRPRWSAALAAARWPPATTATWTCPARCSTRSSARRQVMTFTEARLQPPVERGPSNSART